MSTAVAEPTAPAGTEAPVSLSSMLYGSPADHVTDSQSGTQPTSALPAENGTATPPQEIVAPAAEVKTEPPTKEAEDEKAKAEESHRQAARRLGKQVHELKTQMDQLAEENRILKAKVEGTYEEPQGPTPEDIRAEAEFRGRELASLDVAKQRYGAEQVEDRIYAPGSDLQQLLQAQPWWKFAIVNSAQPAVKAWQILDLVAFQQKYGEDSSGWVEKIVSEHKPKLFEEFKKTLHATPTGATAPTVTQARGDGGPGKREKTLSEMFYGNTPAAP